MWVWGNGGMKIMWYGGMKLCGYGIQSFGKAFEWSRCLRCWDIGIMKE